MRIWVPKSTHMIRNITSIFLLFTLSTMAQPVIVQTDLPSGTISLQMLYVTDNGTSDPTLNGADITWDFTSATLQPAGTAFFGPADLTPYAATYPDADRAMTFDLFGLGQAYNYFRSTATDFEMIAEGVPDVAVHYTDPKKFIQFPFEYQDIFSDPYTVDGVTNNVVWQYLGYGTVITELGTVNNVVKAVSSDNEIVFWNTQPLYPLISIVSGSVLVLTEGGVGMEEGSATTGIVVYPNPAQDRIRVIGAEQGDRYELSDMLGRSVLAGSVNGILELSIGDLPAGNYDLRIANADRSEVVKVVR